MTRSFQTASLSSGPSHGSHIPIESLVRIGFTTGFALQTGPRELQGVLQIRLGGDFVPVSAVEHDVWWNSRWQQAVTSLTSWASASEVPDAEEVIDRLMRRGLLFQLDSRSTASFLNKYRLLPMGSGTGCDEPGSDLFTIRDSDLDSVLRLDGLTYMFWGLCDGYRTVGEACADLAAAASVDYEELVNRVLLALPVMLQVGVAIVDIALEGT